MKDAPSSNSRLGIIVDGVNLGDGATVTGVERARQDERYRTRGVRAMATSRYSAATLALTHQASATRYSVEVRVFDDGVAFRYLVPANGATAVRVPDEATVFNFPARSTVWYHDLDGHYESSTRKKTSRTCRKGTGLLPGQQRSCRTAQDTRRLPKIGLRTTLAGAAGRRRGGFAGRLGHAQPASYPYGSAIPRWMSGASKCRRITAHQTPWRVVLAGADLNTLVNTDIIPTCLASRAGALSQGLDTPWIKPGRAVWRYLDARQHLEGIKDFLDMAGKLGFEYQVVEGLWRRWTDDQVRELVSYSKDRHVGILLWVHSRDLQNADARRALFRRLSGLGIVGVKIDFLDHEAKEVIDLYHAILRDAAESHLMVNFHGANKPAGESRTWPNEMTREGVYGLEHRAQTWSRHDTTVPFTRYLAGHGDFTPVVFGDRRRETSWPHQIATAAIFTSPLLVYGANPKSLLENPAVDLIKAVPSTWDETIVLPGSSIGEVAAFARRKGEEWFIAVLNGPEARTLRVDLKFLEGRPYRATLVRDDPDNAAAERIERATLTRQGSIAITLRPGGGFIGRLVP